MEGCTRDSLVKTNTDNVETVKDVNNTPGSPKETRLSRVSEHDLHGIPCTNPILVEFTLESRVNGKHINI